MHHEVKTTHGRLRPPWAAGVRMPNLILADVGPFFIILVIVVVIGLAICSHLQAKKRQQELATFAQSRGWQFNPDRDHGFDDRYHAFSCLRQGSRRYAYNMITGNSNERALCAFDYHYETYSTDSKGRHQTHHHYFSAVIIFTGLPMQSLFIRPEVFFDKVTEFFGYDDIDFELDEFSRKFYVKAPDKKWAFDVIHQATMEFLLAMPTFTIDIQGPHVMAYRSSCFKPGEFDSAIAVVQGILDRLPNYVLGDLKGAQV